MIRFSDASLRGGIPKTLITMKKYITPNIECSSFVGAMLMETTSDNFGSGVKEKPANPGSTTPTF